VGTVTVMVSTGPSRPGTRFVVRRHTRETEIIGGRSEAADGIVLELVNGLVRVRHVAEDGIFADSHICIGDICLSVDGVPATCEKVAPRAKRSPCARWDDLSPSRPF